MVTLYNDEVFVDGEKAGYLQGHSFRALDRREIGYYKDDQIFRWNEKLIDYLRGYKIYRWNNYEFSGVEDNRRRVSPRGNYSNLCCAAAALLFEDYKPRRQEKDENLSPN